MLGLRSQGPWICSQKTWGCWSNLPASAFKWKLRVLNAGILHLNVSKVRTSIPSHCNLICQRLHRKKQHDHSHALLQSEARKNGGLESTTASHQWRTLPSLLANDFTASKQLSSFIECAWFLLAIFVCLDEVISVLKAAIFNIPRFSSPFLCVYIVSEGRYIEYT